MHGRLSNKLDRLPTTPDKMKVRISDNHLRVRLSKIDVDRLRDRTPVGCSIAMVPGVALSFFLQAEKTMAETVSLVFEGTQISMIVADDQLESLLSGEIPSITRAASTSECGITIEVDIH
jgi:hypothetical protein